MPIKESNSFRLASPYAVSKAGEDMVALQYFLSYGMKLFVLECLLIPNQGADMSLRVRGAWMIGALPY